MEKNKNKYSEDELLNRTYTRWHGGGPRAPLCRSTPVHQASPVLMMSVSALAPHGPVYGWPRRRRSHVLLGLHHLMRRKARLAHVALWAEAPLVYNHVRLARRGLHHLWGPPRPSVQVKRPPPGGQPKRLLHGCVRTCPILLLSLSCNREETGVMFGYAPLRNWKGEDGLFIVMHSNCIGVFNQRQPVILSVNLTLTLSCLIACRDEV